MSETPPTKFQIWLTGSRWSYGTLANELGVSRSTVWGWARGERRPNLDLLVRLRRLAPELAPEDFYTVEQLRDL